MKRVLAAAALHLAYWLISILGVYTLTGMGHGSYVAFALLWSFAALPLTFAWVNYFTFFLVPLLQIMVYFGAWIAARSQARHRRRWTFALPGIHLLGAAAAWSRMWRDLPGLWSSTLICLAVLSLFWWCYFKLMYPSKRGRWERLTILSKNQAS